MGAVQSCWFDFNFIHCFYSKIEQATDEIITVNANKRDITAEKGGMYASDIVEIFGQCLGYWVQIRLWWEMRGKRCWTTGQRDEQFNLNLRNPKLYL